jgi:sulfur-oxidizing protein SoxA
MKTKLLKSTLGLAAAAALALGAGAAMAGADLDKKLVINGETPIVTRAPAPSHIEGLDEVFSGWIFRKDETQAAQSDDFDNPGMIFVDIAQDTWDTVEGTEGKSCASCHGDVSESMAGVKAVYPKWNATDGELRSIDMQINDCRVKRMGAEPWKLTKGNMTAMNALITLQSRGMPVDVAMDGPVREMWERGKEMYYTRTGQLEMSCASCHEDHYDDHIRADHLSQGQINGFPVYRLKNAKLNSVHARFKGCVRDTRAQTYKPGSDDFLALELYVASRGNGLSVEGPSIRN